MRDIFIAKDGIKKKAMNKNASMPRLKGALKYPKTHAERQKLPGHTHNPLASHSYFPDHIKFVNQDSGEKVVLFLRRHPVTTVRWILLSAFLIIAPAFFPLLSFFESLSGMFQAVVVIIWYLLTAAYVFEKFLSWYFHVNILTDERILEVDFLHLVYREITDANIDQIQDVTVEIGGAVRTLFNYGNVIIQTAAQVPKIEFEAVPYPDRAAKILRELRIEEEAEKLERRVR
ncbi:MAG: hypothetical protein ACC618_03325 [Patescibacteria group bacterium]